MKELLLDTLLDILRAVPILLVVYLLIEWVEEHFHAEQFLHYQDAKMGPPLGALLGCIPQCGFSAASATLYHSKVIGAGTLIAVFLSTSDEALPILLANPGSGKTILLLLLCKVLLAVIAGYFFHYTVFRREVLAVVHDPVDLMDCDEHCHEHHQDHKHRLLVNSVKHTLKTVSYIAVTLVAINMVVYLIGQGRLEEMLLTDSVFQPFVTALLGLIPGCTTSILLTELYLEGTITFGSALAGLSTGAGFGFLILFRQKNCRKQAVQIVACTYAAAVIAGLLVNVML